MPSPNPNPQWRPQLDQGLAAMGLDLADAQRAALIAYLALLHKWNQAYNLTAVRDEAEMVAVHLLDSLTIAHLIEGPRCLDMGAGAGLPGIPLAIVRPDWRFTLIDTNGKKSRFMNQARLELGLKNLEVHQTRIEAFRPTAPVDTVMARAFAALPELCAWARPLLRPGGRLVAMKGVTPTEEIAQMEGQGLAIQVEPLRVPGLARERCAVLVSFP